MVWVSAGAILGNLVATNIPILVISQSLGNTAILSSVGARLLLNMKEAGANGLIEGTEVGLSRGSMSRMDFAAAPLPQSSILSGVAADEEGRVDEIEMAEV